MTQKENTVFDLICIAQISLDKARLAHEDVERSLFKTPGPQVDAYKCEYGRNVLLSHIAGDYLFELEKTLQELYRTVKDTGEGVLA